MAWSHSAALGIPVQTCVELRRGMAAQRIEIEYLRAARAHDAVQVATWIVRQRRAAARRAALPGAAWRGCPDAGARAGGLCVHQPRRGRPVRMPASFVHAYVAGPALAAGAQKLKRAETASGPLMFRPSCAGKRAGLARQRGAHQWNSPSPTAKFGFQRYCTSMCASSTSR